MPLPLLIFSQSDYLIRTVAINSHTYWQTVQIQISWLLQKPTDLDLHCLQRQAISGFSRTRVNLVWYWKRLYKNNDSNANSHVCNAMSDWITSKFCDGIFCNILLETRHHYVTTLFIGWQFVLCSSQRLPLCANSASFSDKTNDKTSIRGTSGVLKLVKCIRKWIILMENFIWRGISSVLQS